MLRRKPQRWRGTGDPLGGADNIVLAERQAYGVHVNCYVEKPDGSIDLVRRPRASPAPVVLPLTSSRRAHPDCIGLYLTSPHLPAQWVARRSKTKSMWPGMLDHMVAGGLPHGISPLENVFKECQEEARRRRPLTRYSAALPARATGSWPRPGVRLTPPACTCARLPRVSA